MLRRRSCTPVRLSVSLEERSLKDQAKQRAKSIGQTLDTIAFLSEHRDAMLQAERKDQGGSPPKGGWSRKVLDYGEGTDMEQAYRKHIRPTQIEFHESMINFWWGRLAHQWVRQMDCPWGRLLEKRMGRLSPQNDPLVPPLTAERGVQELAKASVKDDEGNFLPPARSPWPFPQYS